MQYTYVYEIRRSVSRHYLLISELPISGLARWLERRTRDWKVAGSNPCWNGRRIFFSRVNFLCWLLFRYPFQPRITAVAHKRSRSFCQKCRWQVTAKHAYTLGTWLCMKWHGAWLYGVHRACAETAAVTCGTSHLTAKQCCKYTTSVDIQNALLKATVTHLEAHVTKAQLVCSRAENSVYKQLLISQYNLYFLSLVECPAQEHQGSRLSFFPV